MFFPYFQCCSKSIVDINHAQGTALGFQVWSHGGHPTSPLQERLHRPHSPGDRFQILAEGGVFVFLHKKNLGTSGASKILNHVSLHWEPFEMLAI